MSPTSRVKVEKTDRSERCCPASFRQCFAACRVLLSEGTRKDGVPGEFASRSESVPCAALAWRTQTIANPLDPRKQGPFVSSGSPAVHSFRVRGVSVLSYPDGVNYVIE